MNDLISRQAVIALKCKSCGSNLIHHYQQIYKCEYCGSKYIFPALEENSSSSPSDFLIKVADNFAWNAEVVVKLPQNPSNAKIDLVKCVTGYEEFVFTDAWNQIGTLTI